MLAAPFKVVLNLKDFRDLPDGVEPQSPDDFLCNLFDLDPDGMVSLLRDQAVALKRPPRTFDELVAALAKAVPEFASAICDHAAAE